MYLRELFDSIKIGLVGEVTDQYSLAPHFLYAYSSSIAAAFLLLEKPGSSRCRVVFSEPKTQLLSNLWM